MRIIKICPVCKSEFSVRPSREVAIYCSKKCMYKGLTGKKKKVSKPPKKYYCAICGVKERGRKAKHCKSCRFRKNKLRLTCPVCGELYYSSKTRVKKNCSRSCYFKTVKGKGNPNYIDGRTPRNKRARNSKEYKGWRDAVFKRDRYTCVWCGQVGGNLHADHIKPFYLYTELRLDIDNGRTLCKKCHMKTDTYLSKGKSLTRKTS